MARVVIENISKIFRGPKGEEIHAVKDASLVVEDKEFVVLVGPSGSGKSTTLRLIAGLEDATCGTISLDGKVVNAVPPKDRDIAMVFQNYALYPHMTVYENMALGLKLRKFPKQEIERRVREAAELLGLLLCLDRQPRALSGGERQRVAVGRAIVRQPQVFLFDEPLSNLDAQMRAQMRVEISRLHSRLAVTMIYVTHDQAEAMTMGDRIVVMKGGVIQQVADPIQLYRQPANLFVAGFIGSPAMNFFRGTITHKAYTLFFREESISGDTASGGFALRVSDEQTARLKGYGGKTIILGLRPENIANSIRDCVFGENTVAATVEVVEPMGPETYLYLRTASHSFIARVPANDKAAVHDHVPLRFDMSKAHFFDPATELTIT